MKANNWRDLLSDEPFTRKELLTIQDPNNLDKFNFADFYHIKKGIQVTDDGKTKMFIIFLRN